MKNIVITILFLANFFINAFAQHSECVNSKALPTLGASLNKVEKNDIDGEIEINISLFSSAQCLLQGTLSNNKQT